MTTQLSNGKTSGKPAPAGPYGADGVARVTPFDVILIVTFVVGPVAAVALLAIFAWISSC